MMKRVGPEYYKTFGDIFVKKNRISRIRLISRIRDMIVLITMLA
jgi:hypothetical protein